MNAWVERMEAKMSSENEKFIYNASQLGNLKKPLVENFARKFS